LGQTERVACPTCGTYRQVVACEAEIGSAEWLEWLHRVAGELAAECQVVKTFRH
jgi:hypothetical protein